MSEEFIEDILSETNANEDSLSASEYAADLADSVGLEKSTEKIIEDKADTKVEADSKIAVDGEIDIKPDVAVDQNDTAVKPEVTIEDLATQIGWNANYVGEDAIDAATYILKSREIQDTMKDHNIDLKNQLADVKNSINDLKDHNERVYRTDIKRMQTDVDSLKKQKREAIELADVAKVDEIDKQIDDLQKDLAKPEPKNTASLNPIFDDWVKENQWYLTDPEMATYAETIADQYKGAPLDRLYNVIRQKVKEVFPENFENKKEVVSDNQNVNQLNKEEKPIGPKSPVEPAKNNKVVSNFTKADLTPAQITIMNQFARHGVMTEEQYIKDVSKMSRED